MLEIQLNVPGCAVQTRRIDRGRYTIGRGLGADIRLRHPSVARRHALLSVDAAESLVFDMGAADSIRRNGVVVSETAPAKKGDTFACEVSIDGTKRQVTVTFQDDSGTYEVGRPK